MAPAGCLLENPSKEEVVVNIAMQPKTPGRVVTLNPFELGTPKSLPPRRVPSAPDVGCVDWYLYPVSGKQRPTEGSRSVPRGGGAAPAGRSRSA